MNSLQKIFTAACLIFAAVITVATSQFPSESTLIETFGAASNCANATTTNQLITVTSGTITEPQGMTFLDLGMPQSTLSVAKQTSVSGTISGGLTRLCTYSLNTTSGTLHVYSCSDNNNPVCQVSFTPR